MEKRPNINAAERKVLTFLAHADVDYGMYSFAPLAKATKLPLRIVRLACRSLKRKGLTEFGSGLCDDEGGFRGSGYGASDLGRDFIRSPDTENPNV